MWTGVGFSACVVAPPGERSVGASRWEVVLRGVEVSVEGMGRMFAREQRAGFPRSSVADIAWRRMLNRGVSKERKRGAYFSPGNIKRLSLM